jgi:hypothetical protein
MLRNIRDGCGNYSTSHHSKASGEKQRNLKPAAHHFIRFFILLQNVESLNIFSKVAFLDQQFSFTVRLPALHYLDRAEKKLL